MTLSECARSENTNVLFMEQHEIQLIGETLAHSPNTKQTL